MNRPIKFMAWDRKEKEWLLSNMHDGIMITLKGEIGVYDENTWMPDKDLSLYQFTGLLDKDNTEIYEGHILNHDFFPIVYMDNKAGCWKLKTIKEGYQGIPLYLYCYKLEIIGHIAEDSNPNPS